MKQLYIVFFTLLSVYTLHGQEELIFGTENDALGNQTSTLSNEFSAINNPATLGHIEKMSAAVSIKSLYTISGVNAGGISVQIPSSIGTIGLYTTSYGFNQFNAGNFGIGIGKKLAEGFTIGARIKYAIAVFGPQYTNTSNISSDLGIQYALFPKLTIGGYFSNIASLGLNNSITGEEIPFTSRIGLQYLLSEQVQLYGEFEKSVRYQANVKLGIYYKLNNQFSLMGGYTTAPNTINFGIAFSPKTRFKINASNTINPSLGHSPSLSFGYIKD